IQANTVTNLFISGSFAGVLDVVDLLDSGRLIGGSVLATAKLTVAGTFGTGAVSFGTSTADAFRGQLSIQKDLTNDLTFTWAANRITIGGQVKSALTVGGRLTFLSTGSLFNPTTPGDGDFLDGNGAITGTLTTAGFGTVIPAN